MTDSKNCWSFRLVADNRRWIGCSVGTQPAAVGLLDALQRLRDARALGVGELDLTRIPAGRLKLLARHTSTARAQAIQRMPAERGKPDHASRMRIVTPAWWRLVMRPDKRSIVEPTRSAYCKRRTQRSTGVTCTSCLPMRE